ncbi:hypothetical protein EI427_24270 [Flammeovirga pectinis]|uniref:Pyrrolo-quinoline quinone repeat domain-containing protein n=1 Tax=Flammeovirga pectinis TaxID=2494373 RepID=A0A3S9PBA8_9BACT|nr:PQQ-binding-like beta-propeller repeat protein [Flammeovirga pectinis]AZQ65332.1 hypothetical protein EI427_24270 [Flammeovirga pectinis]
MNILIKILLLTLVSSSVYGQGSLMWKFATNNRNYSSAIIDKNTLYIGSGDSCLYALNKVNGRLKWKYQTAGEIKSKPLLYKGTVIFNSTDGFIYAVDIENQQLKWKFKTKGEKRQDIWDYFLSSPVYAEGKIFIGSGDGNLYSIDPENGKLLWKFKSNGSIHATPLIYNEKVFIGSFDGFFYALNSNNGTLIWKFKTVGDAYFPKGEIQKGATIYKNSVIFGSRDYNIYSLDIETGRGMWNMKEKGSWIIASPLIVDDIAYFGTSDSHRFCGLSADNGYEKFSFPLNMRVYGEAILFEDDIYFGCFNGKLYKIDRSEEKLVEIFQTTASKENYNTVYNEKEVFKDGFELYGEDFKDAEEKILNLGSIISTPIIEDETIYFSDANGYIYAYNLKLNK